MWAKPLSENAKIHLPGDVRRSKRLCFSFLPFGSTLLMSIPHPPPPPPQKKKKWLKIRWYRRRKGFQKKNFRGNRFLRATFLFLLQQATWFFTSTLLYDLSPFHRPLITVFGLFSRGHFGNQYFLLLQTTPLTAAFVEWVDFLYIQLGKSISLAKWSCRVFNRSYSSFAIPREAVYTIMHNTVVVVRDVEGVYPASVVFVEVVWLAWSRE